MILYAFTKLSEEAVQIFAQILFSTNYLIFITVHFFALSGNIKPLFLRPTLPKNHTPPALTYSWMGSCLWRHTIQTTNDRPIHRLNYQWQACIHFNWPMLGPYDVIFYRHYKKLRQIWYKKIYKYYHNLLPSTVRTFLKRPCNKRVDCNIQHLNLSKLSVTDARADPNCRQASLSKMNK